jgi:Peroxide stress protein YaaA
MRVILIPCSGRKRDGGSSSPTSHLKPITSDVSWGAVCDARSALAGLLALEPGPDLGNANSSTLQLLPAWQRYNGHLYHNAQLEESDVHRQDVRIFVVSALFGVISIGDTIREYDLAMTDRLSNGRKVNRFWRDYGLASIIEDLLRGIGAHEVHDFLSGSYREAVEALDRRLPVGCGYFPHNYPGLGSGSDYHRGTDVRELLANS